MEKIIKPLKPSANRWGILGVFIVCGLISVVIWAKSQKYDLYSWTKPFEISYFVGQVNRDTHKDITELLTQIRKLTTGQDGTYAVLVYRLDDQTWYGINEELQMPAASLMKVPIMAVVLDKINNSEWHMEEEYVLQDSDKESGSGSLEFLDAGTSLTIKELINEMGRKSDNTATVILAHKVGEEAVQKILDTWKMSKSNFEDNQTTAYDIGLMWKQVFARPQMWDFLQDSIYEDRIPQGLPEGVKIVHKVGTSDGVWSDGGIVFAPKPFILVIMTKQINPDQAKELVPSITKLIWEHEVKRAESQFPSPEPTRLQSK